MSTQIFINPNECKPEFTKIAAHSFSMGPSITNIGTPDPILFYGGTNGFEGGQATWSRNDYDYLNSSLAPEVNVRDKTAGIPIPINLIPDDIITFSGTAFFNNAEPYITGGFDIIFKIGVFHFDCTNQEILTPAFTFIPVESFLYESGQVCFETSVTLGSNFDIHETRLLVGFVVDVFCPGECEVPPIAPNLVTVSYTLDIERPCAVITSESNFIIRNCCEPIITELVNIPGLQVGSFHVDDEGNCWEVISASNDVTNFTRNFVDTYDSCVECQAVNPCPLNLKIVSCCVPGTEFVTGSLPSLEVGDTFVDNNGLCWSVQDTTGGPISEESITVDSIITGTCVACTAANPCPDFWKVRSCCSQLNETIATTIPLNINDVFVDTNGICWQVIGEAITLPTNYDIVVDTVYTGSENNCLNCTTDNPCPEEYFLTVRNCCDNDRVEVVSVPAQFMQYPEGSILRDNWGVCWEIMSYDTTGAATYLFYDFIGTDESPGIYQTCQECRPRESRFPICQVYEVQYCGATTTTLIVAQGNSLVIGEVYATKQICFEVIGYGYPPDFSPLDFFVNSGITYGDCTSCGGGA
jgi:hypothetical protein